VTIPDACDGLQRRGERTRAQAVWQSMDGKLKTAGIIFLVCLALGAGWALWIGLKVLAGIAGMGLIIGLGVGVAMSARRKRISGPDERSRLS
jgi:hypothetical protein